MGDLKRLLQETSTDIKAHRAAELEKQITGLKGNIEALTSRTNRAETQIAGLTQKSEAHRREMGNMQDRLLQLEDGLEDLNNRSHRNNIRIRGLPESVTPDAVLPSV
ncbi:Hypothetical predicted protein, partial [Pelobates cultripes]